MVNVSRRGAGLLVANDEPIRGAGAAFTQSARSSVTLHSREQSVHVHDILYHGHVQPCVVCDGGMIVVLELEQASPSRRIGECFPAQPSIEDHDSAAAVPFCDGGGTVS